MIDAEVIAAAFHESYERHAPLVGADLLKQGVIRAGPELE